LVLWGEIPNVRETVSLRRKWKGVLKPAFDSHPLARHGSDAKALPSINDDFLQNVSDLAGKIY
jgi:hypothetical protein